MPNLTRTQKVATLVLALGPKVMQPLFQYLSDAEVELIAREVAHMGQANQEDVGEVIQQFAEDLENQAANVVGGPRVAREMLRNWREGERENEVDYDDEMDRVLGLQANRPFGYLRDYPPSQIVGAIENEHPQTIALIFGHLPSKLGAAVFTTMGPELRADVARRLATLEVVQPHVIRGLEIRLRKRLGPPRASADGIRIGGEREVATMLNQLTRDLTDDVMDRLRDREPELAARIKDMMFVFEDITTLDDRAIQEVLRSVEPSQLAIAMKGLEEEVASVIWRNLSERAGTSLREELELLGAKPKREVDAARQEIVRAVQRLADEGAIVIAVGEEDLVA